MCHKKKQIILKYENLSRESIKESDSATDYKEEDKIGRIGGHSLWKIHLLGQDMIINV